MQAALVDGDVHHHAAFLHLADQLLAHQLGSLRAGDQQSRPDHHVGLADVLRHLRRAE